MVNIEKITKMGYEFKYYNSLVRTLLYNFPCHPVKPPSYFYRNRPCRASTYLENVAVTGFMKPYKNNKYAFVALLPRENISMADLISVLDAKGIMDLIKNKKDEEIYAKVPKFSAGYSTLLNDSLQKLSMLDAF